MDFGYQPDTAVGRRVMANIQNVIHEFHPFVKLFKSAIQRSIDEDIPDLAVVLKADMKPKHAHQGIFNTSALIPSNNAFSIASHSKGRYNKPTVGQICAVIPGGDIDDPKKYNRDIVLFCQDNPEVARFNKHRKNDSNLQRINELHPKYDTAQYPVMLPHGSCTWAPYLYPLEHFKDAVDCDDEKEAESDSTDRVDSGSYHEDDVVEEEASEGQQDTAKESDDESAEELSVDAESKDSDLDWLDVGTCSVCCLPNSEGAMLGSVDDENINFSLEGTRQL